MVSLTSSLVLAQTSHSKLLSFNFQLGYHDGCVEVLNIILVTDNGTFRLENYRASDQRFSLNLTVGVSYLLRDLRRIGWRNFVQVIKTKVTGTPNDIIGTTDELK